MIFWQDVKERQVYWFLFPLVAIFCAYLLYSNILEAVFFTTLLINLMFVLLLILVIFIYSILKLKQPIQHTFGMGDALLFFALAFSFSSISFLTYFVFGLICSLILHLVFKNKNQHKSVPLAGYLSLFFSIVYITNWLGYLPTLYTL